MRRQISQKKLGTAASGSYSSGNAPRPFHLPLFVFGAALGASGDSNASTHFFRDQNERWRDLTDLP